MKFTLEVVTPEKIVLKKEINMAIIPGTEGELGIMAGHIPFMTGIKPGVVRLKENDTWERMAVGGGFLQVTGEVTRILADTAERAEDIDVERARRAMERAKSETQKRQEKDEYIKAKVALEKSIARLRAKGEN